MAIRESSHTITAQLDKIIKNIRVVEVVTVSVLIEGDKERHYNSGKYEFGKL